MDTMIKEINDNLKAIVETIKSNKEDYSRTLENIQSQMDKKVEEAKKYKSEVDSRKERIRELEDENNALEESLSELKDKYSKMNLVSVIEAGNKEIKVKINENIKEINKCKELVNELTNRARAIRDLLIKLKKDKEAKEIKLESARVLYDYYYEKINEIANYASNHSSELSGYRSDSIDVTQGNVDLDTTMVFDEIADIDDNKSFDEDIYKNTDVDDNYYSDDDKINEIINKSMSDEEDIKDDYDYSSLFENDGYDKKDDDLEDIFSKDYSVDDNDDYSVAFDSKVPEEEESKDNSEELDETNVDDRLEKINELFGTVNEDKKEEIKEKENNTLEQIDNAYKDIFGSDINEEVLNTKVNTFTDIFGNKVEGDNESTPANTKSIEDLFNEKGIDYNAFKEDEKNYLKQIYNEEKFESILNVLLKYGIKIDNIYKAFNIFGELSDTELDEIIGKLLNLGQSAEAIGLVLEKIPRLKKYDLDGAINSFGDSIKDVNIADLIMKAKELTGGNN